MDSESDLPQDYEQIPWSHLVPVQKDRSLQLAVAAVAIIAVALAVIYLMRRPPAATPVIAATTTAPTVAEVAAPAETGFETPTTTVASLGPQVYSEADLMAVLPPPGSDDTLMAIARAEWFVTDYFTVDGDASLGDGVNALLPDVVDLPATDGTAISYVEWARAVDVVDHLDGSFDVTVWFRTLVGDVDDGFSRTDVRAVDVRLVTDDLGRMAVADVPVAATVPGAGLGPPWPKGQSPPPEVVAGGAAAAESFGVAPELQSAGATDDGWRLVFSIGDASGLRFPIAVRLSVP